MSLNPISFLPLPLLLSVFCIQSNGREPYKWLLLRSASTPLDNLRAQRKGWSTMMDQACKEGPDMQSISSKVPWKIALSEPQAMKKGIGETFSRCLLTPKKAQCPWWSNLIHGGLNHDTWRTQSFTNLKFLRCISTAFKQHSWAGSPIREGWVESRVMLKGNLRFIIS